MKKLILGLIFILTIIVLWINLKLYSDNFTKKEKRKDIILQLNFIESELKTNNLGNRMQEIFPEGFVFTNVLYGLSWCELAIADSTKNINLKNKALKEALFAYNEIDSENAKQIFDNQLTPENGIYYVGWKNYLLAKILKLDTTFADFAQYKATFTEQCELINEALKQSNSPYLPSYENQTWPADMCVAMASISNYDQIFTPKYQHITKEWVENVKLNLDPKTKMIPHKVNASNGKTIEGARGCSISLILRLMSEIDLNFAKEQYKLYHQNFVSTTFGLPSINEYPTGQTGSGDIDSGPVILGVGFAGTIVSVGTFAVLDDAELAEHQYKTINSFGMSYKTSNTKKYVCGELPIADAFIAWSRSSGLNYSKNSTPTSDYWRIKFHLISILPFIIFWLIYYSKRILK